MKVGRNAPCPCGSGKKHKNCCLAKPPVVSIYQKLLVALFAAVVLVGLFSAIRAYRSHEPSTGGGKVWSEEHQHWH